MNLGRPKRIFGFEMGGDPVEKKHVTSLFVLYSLDNVRYSYVTDAGGISPPHPVPFRLLNPISFCRFIFWTDRLNH